MKSTTHAGKVPQFSHGGTVSLLGKTLAERESVKLNKLQFQHPAWDLSLWIVLGRGPERAS